MSQVSRWLEVGNHKRHTLKIPAIFLHFCGNFRSVCGPLHKLPFQSRYQERTWHFFCTSPTKSLEHWSSHFEPKIALICFSRDSGQQFPCAKFLKIWGLRGNIECRLCKFDWCCLYYSIRNSVVSLLEGLFARILFRIKIPVRCHFCILFFCARPLSLTKTFFSPLRTRLLCPSLAIHPVHYSYKCACVCVPLYVCVKMCD